MKVYINISSCANRQCESMQLDNSIVEESDNITIELERDEDLDNRIAFGSKSAVIESENKSCVYRTVISCSAMAVSLVLHKATVICFFFFQSPKLDLLGQYTQQWREKRV